MTDATHLATGAPTRGVRVEDIMRAILSLDAAMLIAGGWSVNVGLEDKVEGFQDG